MKSFPGTALAAISVLALAPAWDHGNDHGRARPAPASLETVFGRSAPAERATRTVQVRMSDTMRFSPEKLAIRRGEIVRFLVTNDGKAMHEMVLGTQSDLKAHAELMRKFPGMEHDAPYMAHVAPGKTQTLAWQFTQPGEFYYGCLVPGHFEAGMVGRITVR